MKTFSFVFAVFVFSICAAAQETSKPQKVIGITISLPWANNYAFYDYDLQKDSSKSGFFGLGVAAFFQKGKGKVSLNTGITGDLPVPIGPFDYAQEGTRTNIFSTFVEGLYHRKLYAGLNAVGGINYVVYRFNFTSYEDTIPSYSMFDKTIGLTIGSEYRFSRNFSVAVFYRPAVIPLDQKQYRHLISLDLRFDIPYERKTRTVAAHSTTTAAK